MPQTADDYLELAEDATSKKKKLEYLSKALELEPENLDAERKKAGGSAYISLHMATGRFPLRSWFRNIWRIIICLTAWALSSIGLTGT